MAESEEELKSLLMKVKEDSALPHSHRSRDVGLLLSAAAPDLGRGVATLGLFFLLYRRTSTVHSENRNQDSASRIPLISEVVFPWKFSSEVILGATGQALLF